MLEDAEVPSIQEMYADSTKVLQLPFLYALEKPWERFLLSVDGRFLYYGRQPFLEVYNRVNALDFNRSRMLFIHGALGVMRAKENERRSSIVYRTEREEDRHI